MAFIESIEGRWASLVGGVGGAVAGLVLTWRLARQVPVALAMLAVLVVIATFGRPYILRWTASRRAG